MAENFGRTLGVASLALILGLAACQPAQDSQTGETALPTDYAFVHEVTDLPPDPDILYGQLDNGLRYAVRANQTPPNVASVRMVFNMGSLGEAEDQRLHLQPGEHLRRQGRVLGQSVAVARLALDPSPRRAERADVAVEGPDGDARLLRQPRGRHRLRQPAHRVEKAEQAVGPGHRLLPETVRAGGA